MSVSLQHIADEAKVSKATVSRVLRSKDTCSSQTRERVLDVARKHRYRPNKLVQGMQTGITGNIGVVLAHIHSGMDEILLGIHDELALHDNVPLTLFSGGERNQDRSKRSDELTQLHRLIDRRVDAILVVPTAFGVFDQSLREVWERGVPLVLMWGDLPVKQADFVGIDESSVGQLAARHLFDMGHRRIGHIRQPLDTRTRRCRADAFDDAVQQAGGELQLADSPDLYHCQDVARQLLAKPNRPTAVFLDDDFMSRAFLEAARDMQLRVPDDVSVMGAENRVFSRMTTPALTTIQMPMEDIGRKSVRLALKRINSPRRNPDFRRETIFLQPKLIERKSVRRLQSQ